MALETSGRLAEVSSRDIGKGHHMLTNLQLPFWLAIPAS